MKFCPYCGRYNNSNGNFCEGCGAQLNSATVNYNNVSNINNNIQEGNTFGWGVLGFFIPIAGLILFLAWHNDKPKSAKSAGIGALIRVIISIIMFFVFIAFFIITEPNLRERDNWNNSRESREQYYEGNWV